MGTKITFTHRSNRYVCFLIEIGDIEKYIHHPRKLHAHLFEKLDSILGVAKGNVRISIDTAGYPEVYEAIDLYKNTSTKLAQFCLKNKVRIYAVK